MRFEDHLQPVRDDYVRFYREKLAELKREQPSCVAELLLQPHGSQNPAPFSLIRVDAIYGSPTDPSAVRFAFPPRGTPASSDIDHAGVTVRFGDVSWENLSVSFDAPSFDLTKIADWLSRWIDDQDHREADRSGLSGVLHSISWSSADRWTITIDFGSAPVACACEFVEELRRQGVTSCVFETNETEA